jgi:hypothetical protein
MALALTSTVQANLITNGDMESIDSGTGLPTGWFSEGGAVAANTDTPSGSGHSLQVYDNAGGVYHAKAYQVGVIVTPGVYQFSFSYKGDSIRWALFDYSYNTISADNLAASADWATYSTSVTVPSGVDKALVYFYAVPAYGLVKVDNVALVPEPCTMVLLGLSVLMLGRKKFGSKA